MIDTHVGTAAEDLLNEIMPIYETCYSAPPYNESRAEFSRFWAGWPEQVRAPGFRLVVCREHHAAVGFSFGVTLPADTDWWSGAIGQLPHDVTDERPGRTFAVIEVAVLPERRRRGVATAMHWHLLHGVSAERATLLVRPEPEAAPARSAYRSWGYRRVGQIRPGPGLPVYDAMVKALSVTAAAGRPRR